MYPIHSPHVVSLLSLEQREVGLKKSWPVMSYYPHWCGQYLQLWNAYIDVHTPPIPLHQTFYPLSSKEALGHVQMNAQSFLFTHPRGVSPVWCWGNNRQFAVCGTSSVSLSSGVCSSRMVVVHLAHLAHMIIQRGVPSVEVMRKSQFQWRTSFSSSSY